MTAFRFIAIACCVLGLAGASSPPAAAQEDLSQLQSYRSLREALLAEGWKPDAAYGLKLANGRPLYRFPEVLCGPRNCNARWLRGGKEQIVRLLRGGLDEEYRVAP